MGSVLLLGLLIGMRHALEADHVAAVATIATRTRTRASAVRLGLAWGAGHTITLVAVGTAVICLDLTLAPRLALGLEFAVGVMLVGLGADVLRRMVRNRVHFHVHHHGDGTEHFHAHSHAGHGRHDAAAHRHDHPSGLAWRALAVGLMHGMAGSAALIVLSLTQVGTWWLALAYMALFGIGSMLGMATLSLVIAVPLHHAARTLTWAHNGLTAAVGLGTVALGSWVVYQAGFAGGLLTG
jgi:hypothetical protein